MLNQHEGIDFSIQHIESLLFKFTDLCSLKCIQLHWCVIGGCFCCLSPGIVIEFWLYSHFKMEFHWNHCHWTEFINCPPDHLTVPIDVNETKLRCSIGPEMSKTAKIWWSTEIIKNCLTICEIQFQLLMTSFGYSDWSQIDFHESVYFQLHYANVFAEIYPLLEYTNLIRMTPRHHVHELCRRWRKHSLNDNEILKRFLNIVLLQTSSRE